MIEYARITRDKASALEFLCERFEKKRPISCTTCRSKKHYVMARGMLRCSRCKTEFRPFGKRAPMNKIRLDYVRWLALIKMFELATSARQASFQTRTSYSTTLLAFDVIRLSIARSMAKTDTKLRGVLEADESYFGGRRKGNRGRRAGNKQVVFGILERRTGRVRVEVVRNAGSKALTPEVIKAARRGSMVYTDMWRGYDALVMYGYKRLSVNHSKMFIRGDVHINSLEGFWSFAKELHAKYHGISAHKFVLYMKEAEWRYNNQNRDLFMMIVDYMLGIG